MRRTLLIHDNTPNEHESGAKQEGAIFGKDIADILKNWQGPATIATIAGYIASKKGIPIGNTQLSVGLGMMAAGAVAEAVSIKERHPDIGMKQLQKKMTSEWSKRLQGPSNVSLLIGVVGMLKKIKGSEAAFIAGAIGTVLSIMPVLYEDSKNRSSDEYIQR